jgi:orotate phosphoribosyltransferase
MNDARDIDWLGRFRTRGAVWEAGIAEGPHVKTSLQGKHVDKYFNSDCILSSPPLVEEVVRSVLVPAVAECDLAPTWVVSYAPFGLFLAYACAEVLGARCGYSVPDAGFEIDFAIRRSDSVLLVADDVYSGTSVARTVEAVERKGATVIPLVFALANLSGEAHIGGRRICAAMALAAQTYPEHRCPFCERGSQAILPRPNWALLQS